MRRSVVETVGINVADIEIVELEVSRLTPPDRLPAQSGVAVEAATTQYAFRHSPTPESPSTALGRAVIN